MPLISTLTLIYKYCKPEASVQCTPYCTVCSVLYKIYFIAYSIAYYQTRILLHNALHIIYFTVHLSSIQCTAYLQTFSAVIHSSQCTVDKEPLHSVLQTFSTLMHSKQCTVDKEPLLSVPQACNTVIHGRQCTVDQDTQHSVLQTCSTVVCTQQIVYSITGAFTKCTEAIYNVQIKCRLEVYLYTVDIVQYTWSLFELYPTYSLPEDSQFCY